VFYSPTWHEVWWSVFGQSGTLCAPAVFDGEELVALLLLRRDGVRLRFAGIPENDYCDLLCAGHDPGAVLDRMLRALEDAGHVEAELEFVPEDALLRQAVDALPAAWERRTRWTYRDPCPTSLLDEDVLRAILAKKSLHRHEKKLMKRGEVVLRHVEDVEEALALLPVFFDQHAGRRAQVGDVSLFQTDRARRFYEGLVRSMDLGRELRFAVLEAGGRPVAFHFGFEVDGRLTWYKTSFDVELAREGPGEVLLKRLFEYAGEHGLAELDFTRGAEAFKERFANLVRTNYTLHVLPSGLGGRVRGVLLDAREWAREKKRQARSR
jgi:CelD/BcsL family acetyltransferase involved in cellulose biosynthesis